MATSKPISTISYNTEDFLLEKLNDWIDKRWIMAYQYICHKGEDGDKDHIHLRLEPNKVLDPMSLMAELKQFVFGEDKPRCCRPFRPSKEEDWLLYAVHDKQYLALKYNCGEKGEKLPYLWQDIKCPEYYDMEIAFIRAKAYLEHTPVSMATKMSQGEDPLNLIMQGENVHTVNAISNALRMNDYRRVLAQLSVRENQLDKLVEAIGVAGYYVHFTEDGDVFLKAKPKKENIDNVLRG